MARYSLQWGGEDLYKQPIYQLILIQRNVMDRTPYPSYVKQMTLLSKTLPVICNRNTVYSTGK
jgi:hypothetical protein